MIMAASGSVLVVDDELNIRDGIAAALAGDERRIRTASSGAQAVEIIRKSPPFDVIITDLRMRGEIGGLELVKRAHALCPVTAIIVITAYGTIETAVEAMKLGAIDYLAKPLDLKHLRNIVRNAIEKQSLLRENIQLRKRLAGEARIIARSPQMKKVMEIVEQVAASDVTVLITGESGTGKEMVARAIHEKSSRRDGPFVAANCSALPESLFESEMFGHEKGAFTGAVRRHAGRFELADGGTLFLDEVADMPLQYQVDLLRVIQEREINRVGGETPIKIDVRIISGTNRDIRAAVADGIFRDDLYYRLNVVPIELPPLREREGDVPLLIEALLQEFNEQHAKNVALSPKVIKHLQECPWPGNVRELRNLIERMVVTADAGEVRPDALPPEIRFYSQRPTFDLESATREAERKAIMAALELADDHRERAAELLGISVRTLHYKLKKLGLV